MTLIALQNKIILSQTPPEEKRGSILLPDSAKKKMFSGTVVAVGPGKPVGVCHESEEEEGRGIPLTTEDIVLKRVGVNPGDFVYFSDYHGGEIQHKGQTYLVIDEDDVLAVVPKEQ